MTETAANAAQTARTFGVEIECHMPDGMTRGVLATKIRRAGIQANATSYTHDVTPGWKLTTDGSLGYENGVEVVSPVLSGEAGLAELAKVAEILKAAGCTVNKQCGLHVHVGAGDLDLPQMKKLAINFVHSETAFDAIMPPSRRKNENSFIQSNRTAFGGSYENEGINRAIAAFEAATTMDNLIAKVSSVSDTGMQRVGNWRADGGGASRYRKLNFLPMLRFNTVEFRQHAGTVEADKMVNWVRLCVAFVERSKVSRPRPRTSTARHVESAELGMMLTWLRLTPDANKYFRARRKEFSQRNIERAQREAAEREAVTRAEREANVARQAELDAIARAERERVAEQERMEEVRRAAETAEQRRIEQARYFAERRAAAEAALAAVRGTVAPAAE